MDSKRSPPTIAPGNRGIANAMADGLERRWGANRGMQTARCKPQTLQTVQTSICVQTVARFCGAAPRCCRAAGRTHRRCGSISVLLGQHRGAGREAALYRMATHSRSGWFCISLMLCRRRASRCATLRFCVDRDIATCRSSTSRRYAVVIRSSMSIVAHTIHRERGSRCIQNSVFYVPA